MNNIIVLSSEDWEGLFINNKLVEEGHTLNQGYRELKYFLDASKKHGFAVEDVKFRYVNDDDQDYLFDNGCFPNTLDELSGDYTK